MNFCYKFPVVKGIQAGRVYYIAMVPLKTLGNIFKSEEEYVLPEYRAQRKINYNRIPEIKKYILENRDSYVFSALAASIDGEFEFKSINDSDIGVLEIDLNAKFLINDGQHRKAAIIEALEESPDLGEETISVVLFEDMGLSRSQQMFTDLNKHAVKTSNSIAELYDSRDMLAVYTRQTISKIEFLDKYVDKEKDILGKYSSSLFTLNTFYNANKRILKRKQCNEDFEKFIYSYWSLVVKYMIPWKEMEDRILSKKELREKYVAVQAVIIQALGRVGAYFYGGDIDAKEYLSGLEKISWRRNSNDWKKRIINNKGKIINSDKSIALASNIIKKYINIELTDEEMALEQELKI